MKGGISPLCVHFTGPHPLDESVVQQHMARLPLFVGSRLEKFSACTELQLK